MKKRPLLFKDNLLIIRKKTSILSTFGTVNTVRTAIIVTPPTSGTVERLFI